jgi:uncharacterized protein (TIGR02145 family)
MKISQNCKRVICPSLFLFFVFLISCKKEDQPDITKVTDKDGNIYQFETLGSQVWLNSNLKTTKLVDGTSISNLADNIQWAASVSPTMCWYNNDALNKEKYGALYNWYAVNSGKLCPSGWHVPSDNDWTILTNYLISQGYNFDGSISGNKIGKALASNTEWAVSSVTGAIGSSDHPEKMNASGFNALPGGFRLYNGAFWLIGSSASWWSITPDETDSNQAFYTVLYYEFIELGKNKGFKSHGFSVRCLKN